MNRIISREIVHELSDAIGADPGVHQAAMGRLLKEQRRLSKFIEENRESMAGPTGGIGVYLLGVIARIFDRVGGRVRSATWAQVREAEARVGKAAAEVLPFDDGFAERVRAYDRPQPHILDEAYFALFERDSQEGEEKVDPAETVKLYFLLWVAVDVLDQNWKPPRGYAGEASYTYVEIAQSEAEASPA